MRLVVAPTFTFLFRTEAGCIDRATWWRGLVMLAVPLALATLGWSALAPLAHRGIDASTVIDIGALIARIYLVLYAFVILLVAVSFYNLSAKRWRDRGRPPSLAGALLLALFLVGAADWLQLTADMVPAWVMLALDGLAFLVALWSVVELGCLAGQLEKHA